MSFSSGSGGDPEFIPTDRNSDGKALAKRSRPGATGTKRSWRGMAFTQYQVIPGFLLRKIHPRGAEFTE
jgi:hypothetical protein